MDPTLNTILNKRERQILSLIKKSGKITRPAIESMLFYNVQKALKNLVELGLVVFDCEYDKKWGFTGYRKTYYVKS